MQIANVMKVKIVIIPVHNQLPFVKKCVESVLIKSPTAKIIVIDDGSTDKETHDWIKNGKNFIRLYNEKAQGFSAACNMGIDYTMTHFDFNCLCLLNSDAEIVTQDWFTKVEECYVFGNNIGIAGVVSDNALMQTIKNIPKYLKVIDDKPTIYCNIIHGFCYFIGKKLIEKIGRLDGDLFPHYGSEDDYSLKAIQAGFHNLIVGNVFVKHHNETSYSHSVRVKYLKKTLPALIKRWGAVYVDKCVRQAMEANKYLNK